MNLLINGLMPGGFCSESLEMENSIPTPIYYIQETATKAIGRTLH
jgi:hypothetical protein